MDWTKSVGKESNCQLGENGGGWKLEKELGLCPIKGGKWVNQPFDCENLKQGAHPFCVHLVYEKNHIFLQLISNIFEIHIQYFQKCKKCVLRG